MSLDIFINGKYKEYKPSDSIQALKEKLSTVVLWLNKYSKFLWVFRPSYYCHMYLDWSIAICNLQCINELILIQAQETYTILSFSTWICLWLWTGQYYVIKGCNFKKYGFRRRLNEHLESFSQKIKDSTDFMKSLSINHFKYCFSNAASPDDSDAALVESKITWDTQQSESFISKGSAWDIIIINCPSAAHSGSVLWHPVHCELRCYDCQTLWLGFHPPRNSQVVSLSFPE